MTAAHPPIRLGRALITAAILLLILPVIATLISWLAISRPSVWLPLLNRQLPAELEITAIQGLHPGLSGFAWQRIELYWQNQRLQLQRGHLRWTLHRLQPLDLQLTHFEAEHLTLEMAPPDDTPAPAWQPLPRFWEQPWWPVVATLSGHIGEFRLRSHDGNAIASGKLQWQPGARAAVANLLFTDAEIRMVLAAEPDTRPEPAWGLLWHASSDSPLGPLHGTGEARLAWSGEHLAVAVHGQFEGDAISALGSGPLYFRTDNRIDAFGDSDEPVSGSWHLHSQLFLEEQPIAWACSGEATLLSSKLADSLTPAARLHHCDLGSSFGSARLAGPITLDWQPLALRWDQPLELAMTGPQLNGTLRLGGPGCVLDDACEWPVQLELQPGHREGIDWSQTNVTTRLQRSPSNSLRLVDLEAHLARLQHRDLAASNLRLSLPAMTLWQPDLQQWQIEQLNANALIELESTDLTLAWHGSLTDTRIASPSQWTTQLELTLEPVWQKVRLPTFRLSQHWQHTGERLEVKGILATRALDPLLEHRLTLPRTGVAIFTAHLDSSPWPAETDITAAVLGNDTTLLPIQALHGDLNIHLNGRWHEDQWHIDLTGQADRLTGLVGQYAFANTSLAPFQLRLDPDGLSTAAALHWQVQEFNIGVVLSDISGQLTLQRNQWHLARIEGQLLGGQLHLAAFSATDGGELSLDDLDLAAAVALMNQPDIQVSGTLQGRLPITLERGAAVIHNGTLRNTTPGMIRYRPAPDSDFLRNNPQTAVVGDTLSNFHYQRLEADVSYRANGDLLLATRLLGRNPDLENSPSVNLNLNVEQNVPALMRSLRAGDDIGAWLERRIVPR